MKGALLSSITSDEERTQVVLDYVDAWAKHPEWKAEFRRESEGKPCLALINLRPGTRVRPDLKPTWAKVPLDDEQRTKFNWLDGDDAVYQQVMLLVVFGYFGSGAERRVHAVLPFDEEVKK